MRTISEMDKSSSRYPAFSGAQSWSHFCGPQHKIVKILDIGREEGRPTLHSREHRRSATRFGHLWYSPHIRTWSEAEFLTIRLLLWSKQESKVRTFGVWILLCSMFLYEDFVRDGQILWQIFCVLWSAKLVSFFGPQLKIEMAKSSGLYPVLSEGPSCSQFCFSIMLFIVLRFEWFSVCFGNWQSRILLCPKF